MMLRLRTPLRAAARLYSQSARPPSTPTSSNETPIHDVGVIPPSIVPHLQESVQESQDARHLQAPNRTTTWSASQRPRALGMVGPRFEQTIIAKQPAPYAAIELIHQQPVRWSEERVVSCDGGGGPMGHPKVFINVDKPEIIPCGYCGLPFAHVHHKESLQKMGETSYPLE